MKVIKFILKAIFVLITGFVLSLFVIDLTNKFDRDLKPQVQDEQVVTEEEEAVIDYNDPLGLSFEDYSYYLENDLRNYLANSELGICSEVSSNPQLEATNYTFIYRLKSNEKIVYECNYIHEDNKSYFVCVKKEGYEDYLNGETNMYRDYRMPVENNDMWINNDRYYKRQFSLGKFSDMKCKLVNEDIFIDYYWYHNGEDGPVLIYEASAKNKKITSYKKYHQEIWDYYDESKSNIDVIPYEDFDRVHDYVEECKEYNKQEYYRRKEKRLKEDIELYCQCDSAEDLFYTYELDFDEEYYEALDFYEKYCE